MVFSKIPRVEIDDKNGIFGFDDEGATGKSYLYHIFKLSKDKGNKNVLPITYDCDLSEKEIINRISNFNKGIILLSRLDLYISDSIQEALNSKCKDCLVLLDLKDWNSLSVLHNVGVADIEYNEEGIKIHLYENNF